MSTVELRGLRKSYGIHEVIHGVDLAIEQGEFLALVGPSGCGKSTLLRMIAGLEAITGGELLFDGRPVNALDPKQRNIAMVFQNYALYPHMTVRENMSLNLRIAGLGKTEIAKRVSDAARLLSLDAVLDRRPAQLSGGQRQRVAMGRAIVRDPKVFLFDEPLSNLDAKLRVTMRSEIKTLHQRVKTTSIYVTHDQIEAMTLADRIAVMNGGNIEQVGSPIDLYSKPANRFVAAFIGSPAMNFVRARVRDGRVELGDEARRQDLGICISSPDETEVEVGVRPEHIRLSDGRGQFEGTVLQVEPTGSQTSCVIAALGVDLTVLVEGMALMPIGQRVNLTVNPDDVYLFDAGTGCALGKRPIPTVSEGLPA